MITMEQILLSVQTKLVSNLLTSKVFGYCRIKLILGAKFFLKGPRRRKFNVSVHFQPIIKKTEKKLCHQLFQIFRGFKLKMKFLSLTKSLQTRGIVETRNLDGRAPLDHHTGIALQKGNILICRTEEKAHWLLIFWSIMVTSVTLSLIRFQNTRNTPQYLIIMKTIHSRGFCTRYQGVRRLTTCGTLRLEAGSRGELCVEEFPAF